MVVNKTMFFIIHDNKNISALEIRKKQKYVLLKVRISVMIFCKITETVNFYHIVIKNYFLYRMVLQCLSKTYIYFTVLYLKITAKYFAITII